MLKTVIGQAEGVDSFNTIKKVLNQCKEELNNLIPQAGIMFSNIEFEHSILLEEINKEFPEIELIGCSTDGEFSSNIGFTEDSILLVLFYSDDIQIKAGLARGCKITQGREIEIKKAVKEAKSGLNQEPSLCLTFPNVLAEEPGKIMEVLQRELGIHVPVYGGAAADEFGGTNTFQFYKNEVLTDSCPILLFSGNLSFSSGIGSGWDPLTRKLKVTKTDGHEILEIDERPALEVYRSYLGHLTKLTFDFSLAVYDDPDSDDFHIQMPWGLNDERQSLFFLDKPKEGTFIRITEASPDNLLSGVKDSVNQAIKNFPDGNIEPELALTFSCSARKSILGTKAKNEFKLFEESSKERFPVLGIYAYGEIGAINPTKSQTQIHAGTFITLIMGSSK